VLTGSVLDWVRALTLHVCELYAWQVELPAARALAGTTSKASPTNTAVVMRFIILPF
jgi:hypothetical protein